MHPGGMPDSGPAGWRLAIPVHQSHSSYSSYSSYILIPLFPRFIVGFESFRPACCGTDRIRQKLFMVVSGMFVMASTPPLGAVLVPSDLQFGVTRLLDRSRA